MNTPKWIVKSETVKTTPGNVEMVAEVDLDAFIADDAEAAQFAAKLGMSVEELRAKWKTARTGKKGK